MVWPEIARVSASARSCSRFDLREELLRNTVPVASIVFTSLWELGSVRCFEHLAEPFLFLSPHMTDCENVVKENLHANEKNSQTDCSMWKPKKIGQQFSPDFTRFFAHHSRAC